MRTKVWRHCEDKGTRGRTITLKVKFADFELISRSRTVADAVGSRDGLKLTDFYQGPQPGARPLEITSLNWVTLACSIGAGILRACARPDQPGVLPRRPSCAMAPLMKSSSGIARSSSLLFNNSVPHPWRGDLDDANAGSTQAMALRQRVGMQGRLGSGIDGCDRHRHETQD
jgi:hypothetical protein